MLGSSCTNDDVFQIALGEEWWRIEAWRRLDPRITWVDITMRQRPQDGIRKESHNVEAHRLGQRIRCQRDLFSILEWYPKGDTASEATDKIRARFSREQLLNNSSRGVTPGLIDPEKGEAPGNRVPIPRLKNLPGTSTSPSTTQVFKMLKRPISGQEPPAPERPRKRKRVQQTRQRSARLQATLSQNLSSPVAAFKDLSIKSTNKTPLRVIKTIKDKPDGNNASRLSPRHDLREAMDNAGAKSSSSSEGDLDPRDVSEFERSAVVQLDPSSQGDVSSGDGEISEHDLESEYEDYTDPEFSKTVVAQEIEDSDTESHEPAAQEGAQENLPSKRTTPGRSVDLGSPGPVEREDARDNLPSKKTTPGRSIDLQDDPMDDEAGRLEVLSRFLSCNSDNEEQDHTAEANNPIANMPQVEPHPETSSVQPKGIPQDQTAATEKTLPDAPVLEKTPETQGSNGLLESLVKELSQLRNAVANEASAGPQSADLIGNKVDRLARIALDMQTGAAMLVDEITDLRAEIHRLGG